jgi:hypothetical protein
VEKTKGRLNSIVKTTLWQNKEKDGKRKKDRRCFGKEEIKEERGNRKKNTEKEQNTYQGKKKEKRRG